MKTAMILAAGFGTRLRPYSEIRPKPLFPVMGRPLIQRTIQQLRKAGFTRIIINVHYLGEKICHIVEEPGIIMQRERIELGTGGGLRLAMEKLGQGPALITNGDIYHRCDYQRIYRQHCTSSAPITMVMHDYPRFNKVLVKDGRVISFSPGLSPTARSDNSGSLAAFTGIQVIEPAILRHIIPSIFTNIIDYYEEYLAGGGEINALNVDDFWRDIGTPTDYLALHGRLLKEEAPGAGWQPLNNQGFYRAKDAVIGRNLVCLDWGIIGSGARIGDDVSLERVVVWDGANIPAGTTARDKIIT
ncbi:MAG: NTP transferase domain-containing protein [Deltaproteobacteria bacterium]|nr:NTP transferase domain-containing protein [Deltaproteobacteria bacterium]